MPESGHIGLIHAEIDGELDAEQRAELARCLLADPGTRALRDELHRVCTAVEALEQVDPPAQLRESILAALPQSRLHPAASWWSVPRWRYAALVASVIAAGSVLFVAVHGPQRVTTDAVGTMAARPVAIDTVRLGGGPVSGEVSLYRGSAGLGLEFNLLSSAPVDVLVANAGRTIKIEGVGGRDGQAGPRTVPLPGLATRGAIDLTFLIGGRQVGSATLQASE